MVTLAEIDWQPILEGGDGPPLLFFIATGLNGFRSINDAG